MGPPTPTTPATTDASPRWRIAVLSFVILSLELALIRQIPAEVKAISYFTNLVLMASFFGLGLGCILQERRSLRWLLPVGLVLLFVFILAGRGLVVYEGSESVHFWLANQQLPGRAVRLPLLPAALLAFVLAALPFVALGQALARAMDPHPRLVAYGWDIAGSIVGTVVFAACAFLRVPPWAWIAGIAALAAAALAHTGRERLAVLAAGLLFLFFGRSALPSQWSPYYLVQHHRTTGGLAVFVNSSFHQYAFDFTAGDAESRRTRDAVLAKWRRPYDLYREIHGRTPDSVLILGAGTGNDVVVALGEGVGRIVAVEIDPVILEIGRKLNASDPYSDPRVEAIVDDARHYLRSSRETFDLVVFGTLDSQVLLSGHGNLRLENYVYTREALVSARERLAPGGLLAVYYSVYKEWLYPRLLATIRSVFGDRTRLVVDAEPHLFNTTLLASRDRDEVRGSDDVSQRLAGGLPSTDDWPYLYVERPMVAPIYLRLLGAVALLVLGVFFLLRRIHPVTGLHANYLFLGMGFTLMESSAVVRLALLFGSTWLVNAVVFSSVLLTIFLANALVLRQRAPSLRAAWLGLLVTLLVNYAFPVSSLFAVGAAGRTLAAALLIGVPVFCAALCFSHLFRQEPVTGYPLGVNLVGAMVGGLLEYLSMATGMRAIWLVVLVVYALAWLTTRRAHGVAAAG